MTYALGVDLGTTYSAVAVHRGEVTEIVSLAHRAMVMPSAVFVTDEGQVLVGDAALRRGADEPGRLAREFKRRMGDPVPILVGGAPYPAESLTGLLLQRLVTDVTAQQGGPPERTVLTFPANWGPHKQDLLTEAIRLADVRQGSILTEPEAAAIWYASAERVAPGETIAVYDLGGGTFDAAVLRKAQAGFEVLGTPHGVERLGGIDADEAVFGHVCRLLDLDLETLAKDETSRRALVRLRTECVDAKEALSSDTTVTIPVALPDLHRDVRLTRAELEEMVRPVLDDTVHALRRTIASAGLEPDDIDRVLLVGGASRMPIVADLVTDALGRPFFVDAHPKHVVALGAALAAAETLERADPAARLAAAPAEVESASPAVLTPAEHPGADVSASLPIDPAAHAATTASDRAPVDAALVVDAPDSPAVAPAPGSTDRADAVTRERSETDDRVKAPEAHGTVHPPDREAAPAVAPPTPGGPVPPVVTGEPQQGAARRWPWAAVPVAVVLAVVVAIVAAQGGGGGGDDGDVAAEGTATTTESAVDSAPAGEVVDLAMFDEGAPEHIDPAREVTFASAQITELLYDGLTGMDTSDPAAPSVVPQVAESYETNDDATVWTFTIRDGLRFSDGTPVLPSSFVRGWTRATAPDLAVDVSEVFTVIQGARARLDGGADTISGLKADDDAMTLKVRLVAPTASFDALVTAQPFMPMPEAVDDLAVPAEWDRTEMVGNGPFMLEAPRTDDEVVLVPNPEWDGTHYDPAPGLPEQPSLGRITFRASTDLATAYQSFENGNGDLSLVPPGSLRDARDRYDDTFGGPFFSSFYMVVNWEDSVVGGPENVLLRQAMANAIDREAVNDALWEGTARPAAGITAPGTPGFTEGLCDRCTLDRDAAAATLEAWQAEGNDITTPIRIQSPVPPGSSDPAVATLVANLNAVGITAVEEPIGAGEEYFQHLTSGGCQVCVVSAQAFYPAYDAFLSELFHSRNVRARNFGRYAVDAFDQLVDQAAATTTPSERIQLYRTAEQRILNEDVGAIPIVWHPFAYVHTNDIATLPQTGPGLIAWERVTLDG